MAWHEGLDLPAVGTPTIQPSPAFPCVPVCSRDPIDIGEAARRIGVSPATLRLYERRGLLPRTVRSASGYRQYSRDDLRRARLVRRARRVGLSMCQIAQAMAQENDIAGLRRLLRAHLARMEHEGRKIARLQRHLRRWLERARG